MRAASFLLFASALVVSFMGVALNGPDFSFDTPAPARATPAACADLAQHETASDPALRDLEGCRASL